MLTLRDVRRKGGAEHGPGDLVFAGDLVRSQPARHGVVRGVLGVVEERLGRRREGVVDEVLSVLLAKVQYPLPRVSGLGLLDLKKAPCLHFQTKRFGLEFPHLSELVHELRLLLARRRHRRHGPDGREAVRRPQG